MRKKGSNFTYFIREGLGNIRLHGMMSTAAIMMLCACFLVIGTFVLIIQNINHAIDKVGKQNEIVIYLQQYVDDAAAEQFGYTLKAMENVDTVRYISRDEGLRIFSNNQGTDEFYETYSNDNPLPNSYVITVFDLEMIEPTISELSELPQISKVRAALDTIRSFLKFRRLAAYIGITMVAILAILAAVIISNTIRLTTFSRQEEIGIMKMVGATNHFIRASFLVEGMVIGLVASVLAYGLLIFLYQYILIPELSQFSLITFIPFWSVWKPFLASYIGAGILYGLGISFLTIRKYLRV